MTSVQTTTATQALVADRRRQLEGAADHFRLVRQLPLSRRAPLRTGAGWLLVRAGLRLAHVDHFPPAPRPAPGVA